jgi:MFS family permease
VSRYRRLLRQRDFALLWGGATISALGDGMSFVALVWLALERGGTPETVGWLAAAYTGPVVVGGLLAGSILDRFDRRVVLAIDNLVRGVAIASVPLAAALGRLSTEHLFIVVAVYGLFFMTSLAGIPTLIAERVPEADLTTANALESLSYSMAGLAGPAAAGLVIAAAGAPAVLAIDAATYFVFAAALLAMRPSTMTRPEPSSSPGIPRAAAGLAEAARFIVGTPAIVAITIIYMAVNVGEGIFIVLAPVYAREVLGGGASTYGLLLSAFTAGSLVGSVIVGALGWRWPLGRSIAAATLLTGLAHLLLATLPPLGAALAILATAGLLASSLTAWAQTIRMRLIPPAIRGGVFALLRTLMQSTPPLGAVLAGVLLAGGDVVPAIVTMACVTAIPGAVGLFLPALSAAATAEPPSRRQAPEVA